MRLAFRTVLCLSGTLGAFSSIPSAIRAAEAATDDEVVEAVVRAYRSNYGKIRKLRATLTRTVTDPTVKERTETTSPLGQSQALSIVRTPKSVQVTKIVVDGANERFDHKMPDWEEMILIRDGVCTYYVPTFERATIFANVPANDNQWPFWDFRNLGFADTGERLLPLLDSGRVMEAQFVTTTGGMKGAEVAIRFSDERILRIECSSQADLLPGRLSYRKPNGLYEFFATIEYARFGEGAAAFLLPVRCVEHFTGGTAQPSLDEKLWRGRPTAVSELTDVVLGGDISASTFVAPEFPAGTDVQDKVKGMSYRVGGVSPPDRPSE